MTEDPTAANNVFMSAWGSVGIVVSGSLFNFIPAKRGAGNGGQFGAGHTWHSPDNYRDHCQALLIPSRHKHGPLWRIAETTMRIIFTITLTLWTILDCSSQIDVTKSFGDKYDFSELLATNKDYGIDGVFDEMYQRIQFAFIKIEKSTEDNLTYKIIGADRLKGVVTQFTGEIKIIKITKNEGNIYFPKKPSDDKWVVFEARYEFQENKEVKGSGIFKGTLSFDLTFNKGKFIDNLEEYEGDGFSNFIYRGTWTSYLTGKSKKSILGQGRLPDTGDFDQGDGSFIVNEKYKKNGWETDKTNFKLLDNPKNWWTK